MFDSAVVSVLREAGPWVTIAILVVMGWLIPRSTHRERIKDYQVRLEHTEKALDHEREINTTQAAQLSQLLVLAEAGNKVLEALQKATKEAA